MKFKILLVFILVFAMLFSFGCSNPHSVQPKSSSDNNTLSLSGDPLTVLAKAFENLKQSTDFEAQKTLTVKINGKETSVHVWHFITNTSSLFSISAIEIENGQQNVLFDRVHLKNVQYEKDSKSSNWNMVGREQNAFYFTHDYYELNRNLVLDFLNTIYSPKTKQFGDFVKNLEKIGAKEINGIKTIEYDYNFKSSDSKRDVSRDGKIYIGEVNGKIYPIEIFEDKNVKFKSNGTTVENITQVVVKNIGNAPKITVEK